MNLLKKQIIYTTICMSIKKVKYVNAQTKVRISCPYHGYFEQTPGHHLFGEGCPKCADEVFLLLEIL